MKNLKLGLIFFLLSSSVFAKQVIGIGEYRYGPETPENVACKLAEERAKEAAILRFMGEIIQSTTTEDCKGESCDVERLSSNEIRGVIKNILDRRIQNILREGYRNCIVTIKADVDKLINNIKFKVLNSENTFEDKQEVTFEVITNLPGKVFVFNYYAGEYVKVFDETIATKNQKVVIPSNQKLVVTLPENKSQSNELLMFLFVEEVLTNLSDRYTMKDMNDVISSIPFDKYRVVNRHVNIMRKL